ncbi:MAG TPA: hypothetical protein VF384_09540 [Planctomycetota bacterium]
MKCRSAIRNAAARNRVLLRTAVYCCVGLAGSLRLAAAAPHGPQSNPPNTPNTPNRQSPESDEFERLRAMLARSGPDGLEAREAAVEQLLAQAKPEAHRILQQLLLRNEDPDALRRTILQALQKHFLASPANLFGGAAPDVRRQVLAGYLGALAPMWRVEGDAISDATDHPLRAAARLALQRAPARDLDAAARVLLGSLDAEGKVVVMRCLADMQQILFAKTIAESLDAAEEQVRGAARLSLHRLTYHDEEFKTKAQFDTWYDRNGSLRYVDLAERAARFGPRAMERLNNELRQLRIDAAREFVSTHTVRTPGIDWAAISARTVVDDPAVLEACLEQLQSSLATATLPAEESPAARQAFCKALLQRFRKVPEDKVKRRALVLEVAAYVTRVEETELATELTQLLLAQLEEPAAEAQVSALRALRRFPSAETRAALVRLATALLKQGEAVQLQLTTTLGTLSSRTTPRWCAPQATDADKADWLALVEAICRSEPALELRDDALLLAQMLDARDKRVPEVFGLLLGLVQDARLDAKFRSACLIHLQVWRDESEVADQWVLSMHGLLSDPAPELRQQAAESLAKLPEAQNSHRPDWLKSSIQALRIRLASEPDAAVMKTMVESLRICGKEPQMPEKAIGALKLVLEKIGSPPLPEHQFRLEPLLQALALLAADSHADRGQWIPACKPLLDNNKRQSLLHVLASHSAIELAKDVGSPDAGLAERARQAMAVIIKTAALKAPRDSWTSTDELKREAIDVRAAFASLDAVDQANRLDEPPYRLLRVEVELATGKFQDAAQHAMAWLGNGNGNGNGGGPGTAMTAVQRDRMRLLAAEAQLALGKPDVGQRVLNERTSDVAADPSVLDLQSRLARALFATDPGAAVQGFERTLRATPPEDAAFRARLVEWMQARIRHDPSAKQATLREGERHAALFTAPDCPQELRDAFEQLRGTK